VTANLNNKTEDQQFNTAEIHDHDYFTSVQRIIAYTEDVSVYISGFIAKKLQNKISWDTCKSSLLSIIQESKLAQIKDRGGLQKPSKFLQIVCIEAEKIFKQYSNDFVNQKKLFNFLLVKVKWILYTKYSIFSNMSCVNYKQNTLFEQTQQFDTHRDMLIQSICKHYFNFRLYHEIRKANDKLKLRAKLTNIIHFRHE